MTMFNGTAGNDSFTGGADDDTAVGNGGDDSLSGNGGNDLLVGNSGADTLGGGIGEDKLYSDDESPAYSLPYYGNPYTPPVLDTGTEVDTLNGGDGSDFIFAGYGDNVDGGADGVSGDYLLISFQGAPSGVTVDFRLTSQTVGGATITGVENISWVDGSNFDDYINVTSHSHTGYSEFTAVFGLGGNDQLVAGYYTGVLDGGDGNDIVDGSGSQYLQAVYGGAGDDTLYTNSNTFGIADGGDGNDTIHAHSETYGGNGNDTIVMSYTYYAGPVSGCAGDDQIDAAAQGNMISGGSGADTINGNSGSDMLGSGDFATYPDTFADDSGLEQDVLAGFGGDDLLAIGYGDSGDGGSGSDTLRLSFAGLTTGITFSTAGIVAGLPFALGGGTIQNIETLEYLRGTEFDDALTLVTQPNLLIVEAGAGNDIVTSQNSSVDVRGGDGDDRFVSGAAGDIFDGGAGTDTIDYSGYATGVNLTLPDIGISVGPGGDQISNAENIFGSTHSDILGGNASGNLLLGHGGNDMLLGAEGNDTLEGGAGNDQLAGGAGDDSLVGGDGADTADYYDATSGVTVNLGITTAQDTGGSGFDTLSGIECLEGSGFADTLTGNGLSNVIEGWGGNDTLHGVGGSDTLFGGDGDDHLDGGLNADALYGEVGNDTLIGSNGYDTLYGGEGADILGGGRANDQLYGGIGDDHLDGGLNPDQLYGESGNDVLIGGNGHDTLFGGEGGDVLKGGRGTDWVEGGAGRDQLYGGLEADTFAFGNGDFGGATTGTADVIHDFSKAEGDLIDLSAVDADTGQSGDQAFAFIGTAAFSRSAGELRYEQSGGNTYVTGDTDGDGTADFMILLGSAHMLTGGDFVI